MNSHLLIWTSCVPHKLIQHKEGSVVSRGLAWCGSPREVVRGLFSRPVLMTDSVALT